MATELKNAVYFDMSDKDYFAAPGFSQSGLHNIARPKEKKGIGKRIAIIGSALDILVFDGPDVWDEQYYVCDKEHKLNTKIGKAAVKEIAADTGKEVLRPSEWQTVGGMYESLRKDELATHHLVEGEGSTQACVFAELMGLPCKGKLDRVKLPSTNRPYVVDLKSSWCMNHIQFEGSVVKFWYDVQGAMYMDLWEAATGHAPWQFVNVCVSKDWPHPVWIRHYTEEQIAAGRRQYQSMLVAWSKFNAASDQDQASSAG